MRNDLISRSALIAELEGVKLTRRFRRKRGKRNG